MPARLLSLVGCLLLRAIVGGMHLHDIDPWRAALLMVQHYVSHDVSHALQRAVAHVAQLQRAGDTVAAASWQTPSQSGAEVGGVATR
jgi:hypothetical protein